MPADNYQRRLVDAILRIPGAAQRIVRDEYVIVLTQLFDTPPQLVRSDDAEYDVAAIVAWCARQTGGFTKLVDAVARVEESSAAVDRLRALESIRRPTQVLKPEERALIEGVVSQLDQSSVLALVRDIAARWGSRLQPATADPQEMISLLEDSIAGADEPHPLYVFLARLAQHLSSDELSALVGTVGARTRWDRQSLPPPVAPIRHYFVARLAEDGRDASRYLLAVWLATEDGRWDARYTSDTPQSLEEIKAEVDEQLSRLADDPVVDIGDLWIEFILPRSLLGADVDQWIVSAPGHSSAVGVHFPVSVRDLARMRNRITRSRWRRRSDWLHLHGDTAGGARFEHVNGSHQGLFAELMQHPDIPACLVVLGPSAGFVPGNIGGWLSAGIPVIVWCRSDAVSARFDTHVLGVLNGNGVTSLPAAVWRLRQDAGRTDAPAGHVGRHITLLWDDARRLPPDERPLRQPARTN